MTIPVKNKKSILFVIKKTISFLKGNGLKIVKGASSSCSPAPRRCGRLPSDDRASRAKRPDSCGPRKLPPGGGWSKPTDPGRRSPRGRLPYRSPKRSKHASVAFIALLTTILAYYRILSSNSINKSLYIKPLQSPSICDILLGQCLQRQRNQKLLRMCKCTLQILDLLRFKSLF